jgi:hypothetical protein
MGRRSPTLPAIGSATARSASDLTSTITINTVGRTTEVVSNLGSGTYYFAIMAFNTTGAESKLSDVVSAKF